MMTKDFEFPLDAYLERIGLARLPEPSEEGLTHLLQAQLQGIAFENLDVLAGDAVAVDLPAVCDKILGGHRGGYCFELNTLLAHALRMAGFEVELRMARVTFAGPEPRPRTHLLMFVHIDGEQWLADAGFGGPAPFGSIPVRPDECFETAGLQFRFIAELGGDVHLQSRHSEAPWSNLYRIDTAVILPPDIEMANHFVSTWSRSPFRRMFMVQRQGPDAVNAINGLELITRERSSGEVLRRRIEGVTDLRNILLNVFGMSVSEALASRAWSRASEYAEG